MKTQDIVPALIKCIEKANLIHDGDPHSVKQFRGFIKVCQHGGRLTNDQEAIITDYLNWQIPAYILKGSI